jgi:hypothetical protein
MVKASDEVRLRRWALSCVLVMLSIISHSSAAGSLPDSTGFLAGLLLATALAFAVAQHRRSLLWLLSYFFAGQMLIHVVMVAAGHHGVSYLPDASMLMAHFLAALIAAAVFARGEQLAAAWARSARRLLGAPSVDSGLIPERLAPRSLLASAPVDPMVVYLDCASRRGPPVEIGAPTFV